MSQRTAPPRATASVSASVAARTSAPNNGYIRASWPAMIWNGETATRRALSRLTGSGATRRSTAYVRGTHRKLKKAEGTRMAASPAPATPIQAFIKR